MYDYYYELDVLFFLRLARYLHGQDPAALKKILSMAPEFDLLLLGELCESITWAICSQVIIETELLWNEYLGEEFEITLCTFTHPIINRFCELSTEWCQVSGQSTAAWQEKLSNIAEYYLLGASDSLSRMECRSTGGSAKIRAWFSLDSYDPPSFGNSVVDMLLRVQQENERLEMLLKGTEIREEAA